MEGGSAPRTLSESSSEEKRPGIGPVPNAKVPTYAMVPISAMAPEAACKDGTAKPAASASMHTPWPSRLPHSSFLHRATHVLLTPIHNVGL